MRRIVLFAVFVVSMHSVFAASTTYADAKVLADRDEASVSKAQSGALLESQGAAIGRVIPECAQIAGSAGIPPFVVVAELDASGKVIATWRKGDSDFAVCFKKRIGTLSLFAPPHAPFYTSFEMDVSRQD